MESKTLSAMYDLIQLAYLSLRIKEQGFLSLDALPAVL